MQTISKYFVAVILTLISSVYGDKELDEKEKETVLKESIKKSCTLTTTKDTAEIADYLL